MYTLPELIRKIRAKAGLTQAEFASVLEVSTPLIAMIETGQREVSKNFIIKLAEKMDVHPTSITPFFLVEETAGDFTSIDGAVVRFGEKLQDILINRKARKLKEHAESLSKNINQE